MNGKQTSFLNSLASICVMGCIGMISSCNSEQLPNNAALRISPDSKKIDISTDIDNSAGCVVNRSFYQDIPLFLRLTDAQGTPIGNADIGVYVDFSANTFGGPDVLALYKDFNGNGVVDDESELVSGSDSGVFTAKTGRYTGDAVVLLRMNLSCPYKGEVYAFAGPHTASMSVQVAFQIDSDTSTATNAGVFNDE